MNMHKDVKEILVNAEQITKRCIELGAQISNDFEGKNPLVVGLLKGSVPFMAELCKNITCDIEMDFMDVSSYAGTESTGDIKIIKDLDTSVTNRSVILVEDIVDTGKTLHTVCKMMAQKGAKEVRIVTLLDKPERRECDVKPDYIGFHVPNAFVIGFGLDYNEKYRNLPYVGIIKEEAI